MMIIPWAASATMTLATILPVVAKNDLESLASDAVDEICILDDDRVHESSGLAFSLRRPGLVWTHNDSGDKAKLYAFDQSGKFTGQVSLKYKAKDWEDMAGITQGNVHRLVVADCGDNRGKRKTISLILFDEPDPTRKTKLKRFQEVVVRYPNGAHDCEAIAVDAVRNEVLLFTKSVLPICQVFAVSISDLPGRLVLESKQVSTKDHEVLHVEARRVTTLALPMVTGASIDTRNGDLWLTSYVGAAKYRRGEGVSLNQQLSNPPQVIPLPDWKQVEAIAVDANGDAWVTSEGRPAAMGRLKRIANQDQEN